MKGLWREFLINLIQDLRPDYNFDNEIKTARMTMGKNGSKLKIVTFIKKLPATTPGGEALSNAYRAKGNIQFKKSGAESSLEAAILYTKAVCLAPAESQSLALAHGNRAAALFKLGKFEAAYNDCQCALNLSHPKPTVMLLRQATIARSMADSVKFEACIEQLEKLQTNENVTEDFRKDLKKMNENASNDSSTTDQVVFNEKQQKIIRSKEFGRGMIAEEVINSGDIIIAVEPFAFVPMIDEMNLYEDTLRFVCDNCADSQNVLFPCNICQRVFYCTPRCRKEHAPIHNHECNGYKVDLFEQVGETAHLALRSFIVLFDSLLHKLSEQRIGMGKPLNSAQQLWRRILDTRRDGDLLGMCTNFDAIPDKRALLLMVQSASLLSCYLSCETDFFEKSLQQRLAIMNSEIEWEIVITALLLRLISQLTCNSYSIKELVFAEPFLPRTFPPGSLTPNVKRIGYPFLAVNPRLALYNHSCNANVKLEFIKGKCYVVAIKKIELGQEIFRDYFDFDFVYKTRDERRATLVQHYGFICNCRKCNGDDDHLHAINRVLCLRNGCNKAYVPNDIVTGKCPHCGEPCMNQLSKDVLATFLSIEDHLKMFENLINIYNSDINRSLSQHNPNRLVAAGTILKTFLLCADPTLRRHERISRLLLVIAIDLADTIAQQSPSCHTFLLYAAMGLDIIALRKINGMERIDTSCFVIKVKRAIIGISTGIRNVFQNYIDLYVD